MVTHDTSGNSQPPAGARRHTRPMEEKGRREVLEDDGKPVLVKVGLDLFHLLRVDVGHSRECAAAVRHRGWLGLVIC